MSNDADTDGRISPMIVSIPFPKRGEPSRKRGKDRVMTDFTKKIAKLENEKKKKNIRKKIARRSRKKENPSTPNSKTTKMMRAAGTLPEDAPDIKNNYFSQKRYPEKYKKQEKRRKTGNKAFVP